VETFRDAVEIQNLFLKLLESAEKDILLLLSTANTFRRIEKLGFIFQLINSASLNVNVRLLIDLDTSVEKIIDGYGKDFDKIKYHILSKPVQSSLINLIVDESLLLVVDIKDDSQEVFEDCRIGYIF